MDQSSTKDSQPRPASRFRALLYFSGMVLLLLVAAYVQHGKVGPEKVATRLLLPAGLIWLGLTWLALDALVAKRRLAAFGLLSCWLLYTAVSSGPLSDALLRSLESRSQPFRPGIDEDLDVVVVLGGGTRQGPYRAQAAKAGDRVLLAAQLYLSGHAKRLITTGDPLPGVKGQPAGPKEQTLEIWLAMGIPEQDIEQISGINTYAEIQSLKAMEDRLQGQRVGLLTSASHLPRALRLAKAAGLSQPVPVPADYRARETPFSLVELIPNVDSIDNFSAWQHEVLAGLVNR